MNTFNIKNQDTSPLHTNIVDKMVAGSNLAQTSDFPTKIHEDLGLANSSLLKLARYVLTKSPKGIITLHQMVPYQRVSLRFDGKVARLQPTTVFVMLNCNKNEFKTKETDIHVISDSTLAMTELSYNSDSTYNGISVNGSPTLAYIPRNFEQWTKPYGNSEIGIEYNNVVLNIFEDIRKLLADIKAIAEEDPTSEDIQDLEKDIVTKWEKYLKQEAALIERGILVESSVIYADSSSIRPITTCFQNTRSRVNKFLDSQHVYGSIEAGASFAPETSMIVAVGTVTATHEEAVSGYQYGTYAIDSNKNSVNVVAEADKPTTMETCTRELYVTDSSGRPSPVQLTVNDLRRNDQIVKRTANLASLAVGTSVIATGKLAIRVKEAGSLAVSFRISDPVWTTSGRTVSNEVNAALSTDNTTDMLDFDLIPEDVVKTSDAPKEPEQSVEEDNNFISANTVDRSTAVQAEQDDPNKPFQAF